jgi:acylglycerol lipase
MKHEDGFFTAVRKAKIYYQYWLPEGDPRAVIIISHGLAEHSGRYMNVVNSFVPLGYAVYGFDHLGHGKSDGRRAYIRSFNDFTGVLEKYVGMVHSWQLNKPFFLLGHSMGSLIASHFLLDHQREFAGAILSGPSVAVPTSISRCKVATASIVSALAPTIGTMRLDAQAISKDPEVVNAYLKDPLVYKGKITARLGYELLIAMRHLTKHAAKITLPILILQGSADKLVDPKGAQVLYNSIGSTDKKLNIYDNLYHEVLNEPKQEHILDDIQGWLEAHQQRSNHKRGLS